MGASERVHSQRQARTSTQQADLADEGPKKQKRKTRQVHPFLVSLVNELGVHLATFQHQLESTVAARRLRAKTVFFGSIFQDS